MSSPQPLHPLVSPVPKLASVGTLRQLVVPLLMLSLDVAALWALPILGMSLGLDLDWRFYPWVAMLWLGWFGIVKKSYFRRRPFWTDLLHLLQVGAVLCFIMVAQGWVAGHDGTGWQDALVFLMLFWTLALLARALSWQLLSAVGLWQKPALIFGTAEGALQVYNLLQEERWLGYRVDAFLLPFDAPYRGATPLGLPRPRLPWQGAPADYRALAGYQCFIALESYQRDLRDQLVRQLTLHDVRNVHVVPYVRGVPLHGVNVTQFFSHEVLLLSLRNNLTLVHHRALKRVSDVLGALALIVITSPLLAWVAWRIWREDGGAPVFVQHRVGLNGKCFKFYKFRSMVINAEEVIKTWEHSKTPEWEAYVANNFKLKNDPRVLRIGALIRRTSIDELPQLFNVLNGSMSLVGPRPLMQRELPDYGDGIHLYGKVRPGITGLWQVSGRSGTTFADRVSFDDWYIKNWSLWTDIVILFKTVSVVFGRTGAY